MEIRNIEQIYLSDEDMRKLGQHYLPFNDAGVESKASRMLRHINQICSRDEAIRDIKMSIERIKYANSLLPAYEKLLGELEK